MATTHFSGPLALGAASMASSSDLSDPFSIKAARVLTAAESNGRHYILDGGTGFAITVPVATKGWTCKFTIGAVFATDFVITAPTAIFEGCVIEAGAVQDVAAGTTLTLEDGTENIGDFLELWSDGVKIYVFGNFLTAASITVA